MSCFFFFKHKTAYELRISDWSSDVCSSDLIGAGLVGVMYVLDEPSIGLHQRDNERLLGTLTCLRDLGNTVIVVEHDEEAIRLADQIGRASCRERVCQYV